MDFIYNLVQLIRYSPKRLTLFNALRKEVSINSGEATPSLRMLCPTRWTIRHTSIDSIIRNYKVLQAALSEIEQGRDEYAAKASGLLSRMEQFDTFFSLKLAYLVFTAAEQLSICLQAKDYTVQDAIQGASLLSSHLRSLRNEQRFSIFYEEVKAASLNMTEEPCLPRHRKVPKRYDGLGPAHQYASPKERYQQAYFEALELAAGEVERRFDQADLRIVKEIEVLLLNAANGEVVQSLASTLLDYMGKDFDHERLKCQLSLIPDMIKTTGDGSINKVTHIRTIADIMQRSSIYRGMLSEVFKLLKLYFTFPVTTATAERSFSSLRRLKTFLRGQMTDCRLNNLFLMYVHSSRTDEQKLQNSLYV